MKKLCLIMGLCLALSGCATAETFETLGKVQHEQQQVPAMGKVQIKLPESASTDVFSGDTAAMYECDGYTLTLQTVSSGDFSRTVQDVSGFSLDKLTVMESKTGNLRRFDWVWTAAGEGGDVLCRATVLDDGNYHYCLCAMAPAQKISTIQEEWNQVFQSFSVSSL